MSNEMTAFQVGWMLGMKQAADICEDQMRVFLSPKYATNQPGSSMMERFACGTCAKAIRQAAGQEDPHE